MTNPVNPSRRRVTHRDPKEEVVRGSAMRSIGGTSKSLVKRFDHDGEFLAIDVDSEHLGLGSTNERVASASKGLRKYSVLNATNVYPPPRWVQSSRTRLGGGAPTREND